MKKYCIFALTLVLTAALFAGCGCTNQNMGNTANTSAPTVLPTTGAASEPTRASSEAPTVPTTGSVNPSTNATIDNGNGPAEESTGNASEGTVEGRARQQNPGIR